MTTPRDRLIVALDVQDATTARAMVDQLAGHVGMFKIGSQIFTAAGPDFVREVIARGEKVFLDLKFHDIPNTVAGAVSSAGQLGVSLVDVHALGGKEMLEAAVGALPAMGIRLLAITILTSHDEETLRTIGVTGSVADCVRRLAVLARDAGADGVVAAPQEVAPVREACGRDFLIVTPGIRPAGSSRGDQARTATPAAAVAAGADYIVVGRYRARAHRPLAPLPATRPPSPAPGIPFAVLPARGCTVRWSEGRRSDNVVDARGRGIPIVGGGIGMAVLALVVYLMGGDPTVILNSGGQGQPAPTEAGAPANAGAPGAPAQDQMSQFVSVVLADTEDTWQSIFKQKFGRDYEDPKLVLFTGAVQSACGIAQSAMGPFYCPNDHAVYIDLAFYRELKERFGAPGDFAQAYVIAHEVGHHVQNLLGISDKVQAAQQRSDKAGANALSVRLELQADCYAGVWGHHAQRARNILEPGDVDEALNAASAIGDDKMQKAARGYVVPESFTHGSSAQRQQWFRRGFESGNLDACDTFSNSNTRAAY